MAEGVLKELPASMRKSESREASSNGLKNPKVSQTLFLRKLEGKPRHTGGTENQLLQLSNMSPGQLSKASYKRYVCHT